MPIIERTYQSSQGLLMQEMLQPRYIELKNGNSPIILSMTNNLVVDVESAFQGHSSIHLSGSHYYQAFAGKSNTYTYSSYFQLNTKSSEMYDLASILFHELVKSNLTIYTQSDASL